MKKTKELSLEEKLEQALVPKDEQPYEVPGNWCWVYISAISDVIGGGTPSSNVKEYYENGDIPWLSPADLSGYHDIYISRGKKNITRLGLEKSSARMLPANSVCLSTRAPIGYVVIAQNALATNQGFKSFTPSEAYLPQYLYWYLKGNKATLEERASGTTFLELSGSKAAKLEIPLAPLQEQQRIVDTIERLFSKLDEAKELAEDILRNSEKRMEAVLYSAFEGKLTKQWREKNNQAVRWDCKCLGELTEIKSSKRIYKEEYCNEGIPFFRSTEIVELHDKGFVRPEIFISEERYKKIIEQYGIPEIGDLLVTSVGTIGKTWIVDDRKFYYKDGNLTQVKQCAALDMEYLQLFIKSAKFKQQVTDTVAGTAYNALTIVKFKQIKIPLPTIEEQKQIVGICKSILNKEKRITSNAEEICTEIDLMKKSILAQAFRGTLGTNKMDEKNATERLKEILQNKDVKMMQEILA